MPDNLPLLLVLAAVLILGPGLAAWRALRHRRVAWGPGIRQHLVIRVTGAGELPGSPDVPDFGVLLEPAAMEMPLRWRPPYGQIAAGERLWLMVDGVIVSTAVVDRYANVVNQSFSQLRELTAGYQLHDDEEYWRGIHGQAFLGQLAAVVIWTRDERPLQPPYRRPGWPLGKDWIVIDLPELAARWLPPGAAEQAATSP